MSDPLSTASGAELPIFDLQGDLPWGHLAIEASAGTGKTYTLCQLVVRYIAEAGVPASGFLIVTFTRAATAELRGRIRLAITERIAELKSGSTGLDVASAERHLANLERAITEYDTITITTIHGFATRALGSFGATSRFDSRRPLADEDREAIRSACSDAILRAASNGVPVSLLPSVEAVAKAVVVALNTPDIRVEPSQVGDEPDTYQVLAMLVRETITALSARRATNGTVSFNDALTGLRDMIESPEADLLIRSYRNRYQIVMIDEFQDTDPIQWTIFASLFADADDGSTSTEPRALVLVGDPKQSIYSFRGADISTYSTAIRDPKMRRVALGTNWRSDGRLLGGLESLLSGTTFGPDISFVPVRSAPDNQDRCALDDGKAIVPVQIRLALGDDIERTTRGIQADAGRDAIWSDLVERVLHSLDHVQIPNGNSVGHRSVEPKDIAVLVRTGSEALEVQQHLLDAGVPAVLSRSGKVLESQAAVQWRWLLDSLGRPTDPYRSRRVALSWFIGLTPEQLDKADDAATTRILEQLRTWRDTLGQDGVAVFVQQVLDDSQILQRLLGFSDGDRSVTDIMHIGELLVTRSPTPHPSIMHLLEILQPQDADEGSEDADEVARRVETEESAVKIMTIWVSKGLEFPLVMVPTLFKFFGGSSNIVLTDSDGTRILDVSGKDADADRITAATSRRIEEDLRLAYVALTRASHQVTSWWTTPNNAASAPLSRILFSRDAHGAIDPAKYRDHKVKIPQNADQLGELDLLTSNASGLITVDIVGAPKFHRRSRSEQRDMSDSARTTQRLFAAQLDRSPDRSTNRWSFTAMTSLEAPHSGSDDTSLGDAGATDEHQGHSDNRDPDQQGRLKLSESKLGELKLGELTGSAVTNGEPSSPDTDTIPLGWLPAGAAFGTLVHAVYEHIDFTSSDIEADIRSAIVEQLSWRELDLTPPLLDGSVESDGIDLLVDGIVRTIQTPLGNLFGGRTLQTIGKGDRLNELSFELLLSDGHSNRQARSQVSRAPLTRPSDQAIGSVISRWVDPNTTLGAWADKIASGYFGLDLAGHLTGSIDAVFRVNNGGQPAYVICDYKTNRLATYRDIPMPEQYAHEPMTEAMVLHHYPLQALLYSVALHRFLRSRLTDYQPAKHLGGIAYLFVRGMVGEKAPVINGDTTGVWSWRPPAGLIEELSDLLAGDPKLANDPGLANDPRLANDPKRAGDRKPRKEAAQ